MKTTNISDFARPAGSVFMVLNATGLTYLLVIFISVLGSCQAQSNDNDNNVSVEAVVFVAIAGTMCLIFWACYACMCFSKQKCAISSTPQLSPVHYSRRNAHQSNGYLQNSVSDYDSVPRHLLSHSEHVHAVIRDGSHSPIRISLPEATLHHGDAPPAYEEAIRMKTVNFD